MLDVYEIHKKVDRLRRAHWERDERMMNVHDVRSGKLDNIMPGVMPDAWPKPIVANMIDVSARDMAETMATMPSINCTSGVMTSDRAKKFTGKRTKIVNWYVYNSKLPVHQVNLCDHYNTFGMGIYVVEPDFEKGCPRIRVESPLHTYPEVDVWGNIKSFTKTWRESATVLAEKFPEHAKIILGEDKASVGSDPMIEVVKYCDNDHYVMYMPERDNRVLHSMPNPFGEVPIAIAFRPGFDDEVRGAFDEAIWVQMAKARMALLALEATEKTVRAPIAVPRDLTNIQFGDDAVWRTDSPDKVRRVGMDFPQAAMQEGQVLERELMLGTRTPESRTGNMDASIITGKGIQALQGGFNMVISTGQNVIGRALERALNIALKMDEKFWPNVKKEIRGVHQGTPFEESYTPVKDIDGNYTVDVTYGFASGLDPSRALVFLLQLRGDQLVPRDFVQRQLPMDIDVVQLQTQIDNEQVTDALKQGVFAYVQSVGILAQQGQDPVEILTRVARIIGNREKGSPMHEAILKAFEPTKEEKAAQEAAMQAQQQAMQGAPGGAPVGGELPMGMQASGLPRGVAEGQAGMNPGGRPDVMSLLAGLGGGGKAQMGATVRRQIGA
jgi:hypothetical protein